MADQTTPFVYEESYDRIASNLDVEYKKAVAIKYPNEDALLFISGVYRDIAGHIKEFKSKDRNSDDFYEFYEERDETKDNYIPEMRGPSFLIKKFSILLQNKPKSNDFYELIFIFLSTGLLYYIKRLDILDRLLNATNIDKETIWTARNHNNPGSTTPRYDLDAAVIDALDIISYNSTIKREELDDCMVGNIPGYLPIKKIGEGGLRKVYKVIDKKHERFRTLKLSKLSKEITNERGNTLIEIISQEKLHGREVDALEILNHDNLAKIWDWGKYNNRMYIVEEYVDGTNLEQKIKNNGPVKTTEEFVYTFIPMLRAINHLEKKGYVHRDIKPDNILVSSNSKTIKLTDMQNVVKTGENGEYIGKSYGSYRTAAPEVLFENRATFLSDYYSMGCCMYFALTKEMLFDKKEMNKEIREKRYVEACKELDIIKSTLIEDEISKRYSLNSSDICEMVKSAISDDENKRLNIGDKQKGAEIIIRQIEDYYSNIVRGED